MTTQTIITAATAYLSDVDPILGTTIARVGPCTLRSNPDIFGELVRSIIAQQISVKAAEAITKRLCTAILDSQITPEALLSLDHDALRLLGLSTPKARYIRHLTEQVASGQLNLKHLSELDDETVISQLITVKGIGRWTAEMALIFSLGRPDVLPVDDLGLVEGVREVYGLSVRPTRKEMIARGELWRPYRTFATWYMWQARRLSQSKLISQRN